ncbi:MAG: hypothetical protein HKN42_04675 [Granulosicoccus sp.]|nr:hypothetical protein [Granulosicoccus sp.]
MPSKNTANSVYHSVLDPWARLAVNAPVVMSLRLAILPWMWMTNPLKASQEMQRMVTEKQDAIHETLFAISQTPAQMWFDTWNACWSSTPHMALNKAVINSSRRVAQPYTRRVKANHKRLSSSGS